MNRLSGENSPYLLQHTENPVDWYPWGDEALTKARTENKPIFLSIGYAACHWCHVMAHESFEDVDTAALMNRYFVNIKVDREERPDLDGIYMNAVVAMTGSGGWPMSVFLAPDGTPFYGGTYFPPVRRYNRPSFREVLLTIARVWEQDQASLMESGEKIKQFLTHNISPAEGALDPSLLDQCCRKLMETYNWKHGGWGQAPKFPQPMAIEFLLRQVANGNLDVGAAVWNALDSIAKGGMYDVLGGGFARYSTDERWLVPHFEKMLYDNAQLALVYLYGYMLSKEHRYRQVCEETLDFILRELAIRVIDNAGTETGFFSSLDADSDGSEGRYYAWSIDEIEKLIPDTENLQLFLEAYDVTKAGNFEGKNVLQKVSSDNDLAKNYNLTSEDVSLRLAGMRKRLLLARNQRNRPATDDKVITSWNALALMAFAEAARYLRREDYLVVAQQNAQFLLNRLSSDGKLYRSWRNGRAMHRAYLEDYAALGLAMLTLYKADPGNHRWYKAAEELGNSVLEGFADPDWGFFDTHDEHEQLITRPKDFQDNATPSGNSLAILFLLELSAYSWEKKWSVPVDGALLRVQKLVNQYPSGFSKWLCAFDTRFHSIQEVAILGDLQHQLTKLLLEVVSAQYRPRLALTASSIPLSAQAPDLLSNRTLLNNLPTAYVCHDMVCNQPVNTPENLIEQMNQPQQHS